LEFSDKLIDWYQRNKRILPWRNTKDPYLIWLSEIILQQTRVDQGLPYYLKFVKNFSSIKELASADEEKVMKLWQGLGYYSRARNLHYTAKQIVNQHKGIFPNDHNQLLKLKGVGRYTAAAIASFAFDQAFPVVDGNVYRVLSRIFDITTPIDSTLGRKEFEELCGSLQSKKHPALFNQGIMELGAMVCMPENPKCEGCPFFDCCLARENDKINQLPVKEKKIHQKERYFTYFLIEQKSHIYIKKRIQKDIWNNLYDFPLIETTELLSESEVIENAKKIVGTKNFVIKKVLFNHKHLLTHQKIFANFCHIQINKPLKNPKNWIPVPLERLINYPMPKLIENFLLQNLQISL
jgi:A/G-specific adenine glycosylase